MKILRNLAVPTGNILIVQGEHGPLECLSLGDYGQHVNLNQHKRVEHVPLMPLSNKWVITVSTQYGCSMGCEFCDVPKVGLGRNASADDLTGQVKAAMSLHPEINQSDRLNVHFARMGEPTWNPGAILACADWLRALYGFNVHPVVSTMMPRRNGFLAMFIYAWMVKKNYDYDGNAGLQISINSTDAVERDRMFHGNAWGLPQIAEIMDAVPKPKGRKVTLNFAVAGYTIDADVLLNFFSPDHFIVKLTPMHKTATALANGVETAGDYTESYPYEHHEAALKRAGYEVLTFIASREEDLGRITCGNAILSGTLPLVPFTEEIPVIGSRP